MTYVMDSSAMIAFPRNETGAATVADLLTDPQHECCAHALNLCEVFYDFARSGGEGEVKNGEGVYGLRRALVLAGSETQVMSLWPVSDKGTRDLMIEYYRRLLRGEGRGAAGGAVANAESESSGGRRRRSFAGGKKPTGQGPNLEIQDWQKVRRKKRAEGLQSSVLLGELHSVRRMGQFAGESLNETNTARIGLPHARRMETARSHLAFMAAQGSKLAGTL